MRSITAIQADIDSTEAAIQAGNVDQSQVDVWNMQIADFKIELTESEVYHQESVQAQAEQIGGLKETVRSIFEASFPKDETVKLMGLTEYENTQQTFNQLIDQAVDEDQTVLYAAFQQQLEQRDERIRTLTLQSLEFERQLGIANEDKTEFVKLNAELAEQVETQQYTIQTHEQNAEDRDDVIEQNVQEIQRLKQREFDLQQQIANVQTIPQIIDIIPTVASESLSERIAQAKVNSKLQLANVQHIAANWVEGINSEGNKEVAHVNDVEQVMEFPNIEPVSEVEEIAGNIPFQETMENSDSQGDSADIRNESVDESLEQNAKESEVEREDQLLHPDEYLVTMKQFNDLSARVDYLYTFANITEKAVA